MGRRHRSEVMTYWAPTLTKFRGGRPLLLAYLIADRVPDDSDTWWSGHENAAVEMGVQRPGEPFDDRARQIVKRTVRSLVAAGFLEVQDGPAPGVNTVYRVHWKEPPEWPSRAP